MRNIISRSFDKNMVDTLCYDNGNIVQSVVFIPTGFATPEQAERYIRKNNLVSGKLISVEKITRISNTYGMEISTFLAHATPYDERSKDTRNLVTKNITSKVGELLYMTSDYKLERTTVVIPDNTKNLDKYAQLKAPKGTKGVTIENIREITCLYGMTESDFIAHAKPMIDNNHFAIE